MAELTPYRPKRAARYEPRVYGGDSTNLLITLTFLASYDSANSTHQGGPRMNVVVVEEQVEAFVESGNSPPKRHRLTPPSPAECVRILRSKYAVALVCIACGVLLATE